MPIRLALLMALAAGPALAADLDGAPPYGRAHGGVPGLPPGPAPGPRRIVAPPPTLLRPCPPPAYVTRAPTNAPDDPTYVGSFYGLGKPSYYGTVPPLGVDDPYGRPLRVC